MNYIKITTPDVNNGLGCRVTLWISGCTHRCMYCQNPQTWNSKFGKDFDGTVMQILYDEVSHDYIQGLTLSGGDPLCSYNDGLMEFLVDFRNRFGNTKDIWLYTGFTMSEIQQDYADILQYVDYIVDGRYDNDLRDVTLAFRGSKNQHIWKKDGMDWVIADDKFENNVNL